MGLKNGGLRSGGPRNLSESTAAPAFVDHQWAASNFATPWPDEISSANMSINGGLSQVSNNGDDFVTGDGTDDYGTAAADPLGNSNQFAIAFTVIAASGDVSDFEVFCGLADSAFDNTIRVRVNSDKIEFNMRTTGDDLNVQGDTIADSSVHAVIINKDGTSSSDVEIYVDDMSNDVASVTSDQGSSYDAADWSYSGDWGFWANNQDSGSSISDYINADMGTIEFGSGGTYSETQRNNFVSRRPEVS